MPGVPRELIEHKLHIDPNNTKPIKQCLHHLAQDKKDVIKEIARLLDVFHPGCVPVRLAN
jgi:hypothetical protein